MKKLFVLLLALALLIPMGLTANAEEAAVKPFYGLGWSDLDEEKFPNLNGAYVINVTIKGGELVMSRLTDSTPEQLAASTKAEMLARPEGSRYLHFFGPRNAFLLCENLIYMDEGVAQLKALMEAFFKAYKDIDGPLDGVIIDMEWVGVNAYYIYKDVSPNNPDIYNQIVEDPRYETEIRPLLEERGFPFYEGPNAEIYAMHPNTSTYAVAAPIWDAVIQDLLAEHSNEMIFEPLQKYYPDATFSDYLIHDIHTWQQIPGSYGSTSVIGGNSIKIGNVSNVGMYNTTPVFYMWKSMTGEIQFITPVSYNESYYERTAFNMFRFNAISFKQVYASTDTKRFSIWVAEYDYNTGGNHDYINEEAKIGTVDESPYYAESLLHAGLLNPEPFLVYMNYPEFEQEEYDRYSKVISDILAELTRVVGYADRKPIELPINWNSDFILSGMYANGKNYWRITPDTNEVSLEDFKVAGDDPTFSVRGQTVTFPGGKIIEDGTVSQVGTCGYWVETAADVMPVITNDTARYANNPSFFEDFETYGANTQYSVTENKYTGAWDVKFDNKARPTVVEQNGSKALSLSGTNTFKNINHVQKITAGDSYAAQQVWELTLTLPEGLDGEVVLLKTNGKNGDLQDGGFKIADGKIYYDENGEYKELADAKAGTYTFRRTVDFTNTEAFTSSYYLLDTAGKTLAEAENAAMVTFKIPVSSIEFSTKKVSGTLYLDNYKLYPAGVTAELTLYDAKTGIQATDITAARTADTAYRVSWMNAANRESTATLLYDVYEGDTVVSSGNVIRELNMLPGTDGVETGVVAVKEGQSVKVYVQSEKIDGGTAGTNTPDTPADPTDPEPDQNDGPNTVLILTIASVALVAVLLTAALVVRKKTAKKA